MSCSFSPNSAKFQANQRVKIILALVLEILASHVVLAIIVLSKLTLDIFSCSPLKFRWMNVPAGWNDRLSETGVCCNGVTDYTKNPKRNKPFGIYLVVV